MKRFRIRITVEEVGNEAATRAVVGKTIELFPIVVEPLTAMRLAMKTLDLAPGQAVDQCIDGVPGCKVQHINHGNTHHREET